METGEILVIDLFAGPGGLGEGISSCTHKGKYPFKIKVSVEKDAAAHKTLTLRAFYRKVKDLPGGLEAYNAYIQKKISKDDLFARYPEQAFEASQETLKKPRALGVDNDLIHGKIRDLVKAHNSMPKVVIGGPPCQAYSLAGRSRNAGIKDYSAENDHRNFLYLEYLKVLSIAQPEVFVMENVKGILSAKVNGKKMFPQILEDLSSPGRITKMPRVPSYKIYSLVEPADDPENPEYQDTSDFLIRSEKYGVPQARHRVILLGVRNDIQGVPSILEPMDGEVTVKQVLGDLPPLRSGLSKIKDDVNDWEKIVNSNVKRLLPLLSKFFGRKEVERLNLAPLYGLCRKKTEFGLEILNQLPGHLEDWYTHNSSEYILNHETRGHMESDLLRYAFSATYTHLNNGISPKSRDFPDELAPAHGNWKSGSHADRFKTQAANRCSATITSHISKDGHYFIHYDPRQCRSLTVREAARLQTFPDNYFFEGNRTQQYTQVGNAVPPYLAKQIGKVVLDLLTNNDTEC